MPEIWFESSRGESGQALFALKPANSLVGSLNSEEALFYKLGLFYRGRGAILVGAELRRKAHLVEEFKDAAIFQ